jgi:Arc/MetJ-type ribon-helix-helix transcriptional regulator|tara:strand:+ start:353 stop:910 length:558 start_codon:yes stop_codon:yes gene_type:complete
MVPLAPKNIGKLYLILGTNEIKLSDFTREANERWLRITNQDTWSSTLSRVRIARQEAIEYTLEAVRSSGFPDRGSVFAKMLEANKITNRSDVILAAIQYLRSVEKEINTPTKEIRNLILETRIWKKKEVQKWNFPLCISRMLVINSKGSNRYPLLEYPRRRKNDYGYVVLTEAGRDYLDKLSLEK